MDLSFREHSDEPAGIPGVFPSPVHLGDMFPGGIQPRSSAAMPAPAPKQEKLPGPQAKASGSRSEVSHFGQAQLEFLVLWHWARHRAENPDISSSSALILSIFGQQPSVLLIGLSQRRQFRQFPASEYHSRAALRHKTIILNSIFEL